MTKFLYLEQYGKNNELQKSHLYAKIFLLAFIILFYNKKVYIQSILFLQSLLEW